MAAGDLTPKREAFSRKFVECGNGSEAYRHAFSAEKMSADAIHVEASRLLSDPKVSLRVQELQSAHAKRHEITVDSLTEYLKDAIKLAKECDQTSTIVAAVKELGTLHGIRVEKTDSRVRHESALDLLNDQTQH